MQRNKNTKRLAITVVILTLLLAIGVAFFRGSSEQKVDSQHHAAEMNHNE